MEGTTLLYIGSIAIAIWGIAHLIPTSAIVKGFGELSPDNKKIITMEWIAEGLALIFIGALVLLITMFYDPSNSAVVFVIRASALMLVVMAILSFFTGFRTSIIPIKICPFVKITVAVLFYLGSAT
ncbi:MAG: hypothetical protein A2V66_18440 [Ignavibacteria bacterium RBG_13_36_8]|nr:MAG: hypothetical protein A2V66_18440 [Ignavibacteria bacterium RBG_13_36_8]